MASEQKTTYHIWHFKASAAPRTGSTLKYAMSTHDDCRTAAELFAISIVKRLQPKAKLYSTELGSRPIRSTSHSPEFFELYHGAINQSTFSTKDDYYNAISILRPLHMLDYAKEDLSGQSTTMTWSFVIPFTVDL